MRKFIDILYYFLVVICMWIALTSTITRFKNTKISETEIFLHIPQSFVLDFNE